MHECDSARQLVHFATRHGVLPKQLGAGLLMLRDGRLYERSVEEMLDLAGELKDLSYRIFAADGRLHVVAAGLYLDSTDPYDLLDQLVGSGPAPDQSALCFLPGLRDGQGGHRADAGKELPAGRSAGLGPAHRARAHPATTPHASARASGSAAATGPQPPDSEPEPPGDQAAGPEPQGY